MSHPQPEGFLAVPSTGKGPGVLVLHPWWGLNSTIKDFCTRLAGAGFIAFAPDMFHGQLATTIEEAERLSAGADADEVKATVARAVDFVSERIGSDGDRLAVVGFSFGAAFALDISTTDPDRIASVVVFYGTYLCDFTRSKASYLGHFAESDQYEPETYVNAVEQALREAGRPLTFYRYPGVGHWFVEQDRKDAYNKAAADLAWERTMAFLKA